MSRNTFAGILRWTSVLALVYAAAVYIGASSTTEAARRTIESGTTSLPTTLDELAAYPDDYRKAFVSFGLSAETRSAFWREHIRRFAERHTTLTESQRLALVELAAAATPEALERGGDIAVCGRLATAFTDHAQLRELTTLGSISTPAHTGKTTWLALASILGGMAVATSADTNTCDCYSGSYTQTYCDCMPPTCDGGHCDMPLSGPYCGCLDTYLCVGTC